MADDLSEDDLASLADELFVALDRQELQDDLS